MTKKYDEDWEAESGAKTKKQSIKHKIDKKTAMVIAGLALMVSGIGAVGIRAKHLQEQKEKDKIRQTLENVLIPNAETALNKAIKENKSLQDSIAYYTDWLSQQSNITDANLEDWYQKIDMLAGSLKLMEMDWKISFFDTRQEWNKHKKANERYDIEAIPASAKDKAIYLQSTIIKGLYNDNRFEPNIPVWTEDPKGYTGHYAFPMSNTTYQEACKEIARYSHTIGGMDFEHLIKALRVALNTTKGANFTHNGEVIKGQTSPDAIKNVLMYVQAFLNNIDNSQKVINQGTLEEAKERVAYLLTLPLEELALYMQNSNKVEKYKEAQKWVRAGISQDRSQMREYRKKLAEVSKDGR